MSFTDDAKRAYLKQTCPHLSQHQDCIAHKEDGNGGWIRLFQCLVCGKVREIGWSKGYQHTIGEWRNPPATLEEEGWTDRKPLAPTPTNTNDQ